MDTVDLGTRRLLERSHYGVSVPTTRRPCCVHGLCFSSHRSTHCDADNTRDEGELCCCHGLFIHPVDVRCDVSLNRGESLSAEPGECQVGGLDIFLSRLV